MVIAIEGRKKIDYRRKFIVSKRQVKMTSVPLVIRKCAGS